jgi:hypothetical protein
MNELDMIRDLLAEAPPSAEVIAQGRRRVAEDAARPRRRPGYGRCRQPRASPRPRSSRPPRSPWP